jgi:CubicO group peptidase (beta-lactamase class C family)
MYSNGGYLVLGLIVERASGQSYYDYVSEHIFKPSAMTRTGYPEIDDTSTGRATGYTHNGAGFQNAVYGAPARGSSAGGAYSTVHDLAAFASAMHSHELLNEMYANWMLARFPGDAPSAQGPTPTTLGVAGGTPGANAVLLADFRSDETVVVLANLDPPAAEALGRQIRRWSVEAHI